MTNLIQKINRHISKLVILSSLLVLFGFLNLPANAQKIGIKPFREENTQQRGVFRYVANAGEVINDAVVVTNGSDFEGKATVSAKDATTDTSGNFSLLPNETENTKAGRWISLAASDVDVPAGKALKIPFTINVPAGTPAGEYAAGIAGIPNNSASTEAGLSVGVRSGVAVYITVRGDLRIDNEVKGLAVANPTQSDFAQQLNVRNNIDPENMVINFEAINKGNMFSRIQGELKVTTPDNQEKTLAVSRVLNIDSSNSNYFFDTNLPYQVGTTKINLTYESESYNEPDTDFTITDASKGELNFEFTLTEADLQRFRELKNNLLKAVNDERANQTNQEEEFVVEAEVEEEPEEEEQMAIPMWVYYAGGAGGALILIMLGAVIYLVQKGKKNKNTQPVQPAVSQANANVANTASANPSSFQVPANNPQTPNNQPQVPTNTFGV